MADWLLSDDDRRSLSGQLSLIGDVPNFEGKLGRAKTALTDALPDLPVTLKSLSPGWLVIRGAPVERMEEFLLGLSALLGDCFAFLAERGGALVQDIRPSPGNLESRSSSGSAVELDLHTEAAFHERRPDLILLGCLTQPAEPVPTLVAPASTAVAGLDAADREHLRRPVFRFRTPELFSSASRVSSPGAVLSGPDVEPRLRVNCNPGHTATADRDASGALDRLRTALRAGAVALPLAPGDVLILDNHAAAHGRPAFTPEFSDRGRWLKRVYVARNLWTDAGAPPRPSRVVA